MTTRRQRKQLGLQVSELRQAAGNCDEMQARDRKERQQSENCVLTFLLGKCSSRKKIDRDKIFQVAVAHFQPGAHVAHQGTIRSSPHDCIPKETNSRKHLVRMHSFLLHVPSTYQFSPQAR